MPGRCEWAQGEMEEYHDTEWGVPVHADRALFEFLTLEGAQAGLSWRTILRKRDGYRRAFDGFDIVKVAAYDDAKTASLLEDPGIVRHRLKVASTVTNAQAVIAIQEEFGSFDAFIWGFVDGDPIVNSWTETGQIPASTPVSDEMTRELKRRGLKFVGTTICYAFMQATGMVNDHVVSCIRYREV